MSSRPFTITIAAVLQALIGLGAGLAGLYSFYAAVTGQVNDVMSAVPLAAAGLGVGALLVFVAHGLWQLNDWARTPVFVTQLFLAVIAYYMFTGEQYGAAALFGATAVAAGAAVLSPPTTAALFPVEEPQKKKR